MCDINGNIYMAFGDTFSHENQRGDYYKNALGKIKNPDNFEEGIEFEWIKINPNNGGLINSADFQNPTSMIPTSCIALDIGGTPTIFMHIMEIRNWTVSGTHWTIEGSRWASSDDEGDTWTLHERIFDADSNFAQIACVEKDGYVYILGTTPAGEGQIRLARVKSERLTEADYYEYFGGTDSNGNPTWKKTEDEAVIVIDSVNKEFGIVYDEGLDCFIETTLDNTNQLIIARDAKEIWGPYSNPVILFDEDYVEHEDARQRFFYGSFMHSKFMKNNGSTVYMTLNKWVPYNIQWMEVNFEVNR